MEKRRRQAYFIRRADPKPGRHPRPQALSRVAVRADIFSALIFETSPLNALTCLLIWVSAALSALLSARWAIPERADEKLDTSRSIFSWACALAAPPLLAASIRS